MKMIPKACPVCGGIITYATDIKKCWDETVGMCNDCSWKNKQIQKESWFKGAIKKRKPF